MYNIVRPKAKLDRKEQSREWRYAHAALPAIKLNQSSVPPASERLAPVCQSGTVSETRRSFNALLSTQICEVKR
jgi:hypothetical protein